VKLLMKMIVFVKWFWIQERKWFIDLILLRVRSLNMHIVCHFERM